MKRIPAVFAIAAIPFLAGSVSAGGPDKTDATADVLICRTQDGDITVTADRIMIRDQVFLIEEIIEPSVLRLFDARTNTSAELDARGEDGIYLTVSEPGSTMQVVAARQDMVLKTGRGASLPAAARIADSRSERGTDMIMTLLQTESGSRPQ